TFACSVLELRCALVNYQTWSAFMLAQKPLIASTIGLVSPFLINNTQMLFTKDSVNDRRLTAVAAGLSQVIAAGYQINMAVYEFVRKIAGEYMGKKFVVTLPFLLQHI